MAHSKVRPVGNWRADKTFFMVGFVVWLICRILLTSRYGYDGGTPAALLRLGLYGGLFLCVFSELFAQSLTLRSLALVTTLAALVLLLWRVGGSDIAYMLIIAFTSRHYSFRDVLRVALAAILISIFVVVASFCLGFIGQTYDNDRGRGSLGFGWTTFLSHYYLMLVIGYVALRGEHVRVVELLVLALVDFGIWFVTGARNSFALVLVFVGIVLIAKVTRHWKAGKPISFIAAVAFPVSAVFSWLLYMVVDPYSSLGMTLNTLFTSRIVLTQRAVDLYGISPFGNIVVWVTNSSIASGTYAASDYLYVDCSYINELINYGWVFFIALMTALSVVAFKATNRGGVVVGVAFAIFAVHGIVDPQLLDLQYCAFLLLLGNVFDSPPVWDRRMAGFSEYLPGLGLTRRNNLARNRPRAFGPYRGERA